ncbi:bacteriocin [Chryseobacterium sp. WG23]|uniref:bacteriocin n=1 Tax=Chryseobacterium sp. WG23 TaxID=2926910 RepID=UPI00211E225E|nr:bacteriocin [Chryseobacterium sp. WG23]MCQ9633892.1 bacteriocin [Chryseobacterium sp. WG23]
METKILSKGKKLNKKELKTIAGGMLNCMPAQEICPPHLEPCESHVDENGCSLISPFCGQKICRPQ